MSIDESLVRIIAYWKSHDVPIRPRVADGAFAAFEAKYNVVLPAEVRSFYCAVDGMGEYYDEDFNRIWPLSEVKPVHLHHSDNNSQNLFAGFYAFADHSISLWDYVIKLDHEGSGDTAVYELFDETLRQVSTSFAEFLAIYADDPRGIWG